MEKSIVVSRQVDCMAWLCDGSNEGAACCFCSGLCCSCTSTLYVCVRSYQCVHEVARPRSYRKYSWKRQLTIRATHTHIRRIHFHGKDTRTHTFSLCLINLIQKHHSSKEKRTKFHLLCECRKRKFSFSVGMRAMYLGNVFVEFLPHCCCCFCWHSSWRRREENLRLIELNVASKQASKRGRAGEKSETLKSLLST